MRTISHDRSALLIVDMQARLVPVIDSAAAVIANVQRLLQAADLFQIPVLVTEQNSKGIGTTVPELSAGSRMVLPKMTFNACSEAQFRSALPDRPEIIVVGCEAHVCVLQTVLGLVDLHRDIFIVRDATGSRRAESKETAIRRMEKHGVEVVTTEMVLFEWLGTFECPQFRQVLSLLK